MTNRRHYLSALLALASGVACPAVFASNGDIGVVLLHGKGGLPTRYINDLVAALQSQGNLVATPEMPWAKGRIYDATFEDALREIDREVAALQQKGAKLVVVGGHSLGANVALGYAASRPRLGGVILIAPAHNPEQPVFARRLGADLAKAHDMVATGRGKEKATFSDLNQGNLFKVNAAAEVYVSWFDPNGPAVMPKSAAAIKSSIPLLCVVGSKDRTAPSQDYIFDKAPAHPMSKFVTVNADHLSVPTVAIDAVTTWLFTLRP